MNAPRVILASAGSGKTWQLSRAYVALLERDAPPAALLATTFTRKAAGEILQRVLERLLETSGEPKALARLASFARELEHARVQTLDSFFVRLAGRFAQELGLPPGFRLGSEPELLALRAQAVSRALEDVPPRELAALLRQMQRDGAGRRVHETLLDIVNEGHELLLDSAPGAWSPIRPPTRLDEAAIAAAVELLQAADVPMSGSGARAKPNGHWINAQLAACEAARVGDWEGLLSRGLGHALLTKGPYRQLDFTPALSDALSPLVQHARGVLLAEHMAAGRAFRQLLERYDAALGQCQRSSGCYGFADLPRLLRGRLALDGAALGLRNDGGLAHLLLDEFQDTSVAQWRVLQPLVDACAAVRDGSRTLFCVGDVKQSIYGWRDGEPELLVGLSQRPGITADTLDESRRSAPVVLAAVNRVFADLPSRAVFADDRTHDRAALREAAGNWAARFGRHHAHDTALAGCFSLREVGVGGDGQDGDADAEEPDGRGAARRRAVLEAACEHVAALAERAPEASIGILVRGRKAIAPLILGLRARGVHACGEGGNQLTDSAAVLLALSLLTLADHPDDTAAAFHVASSPLAGELGITDQCACERALEREAPFAARPAAAARLTAAAALRERLQRVGYGPVLAKWSAVVAAAPSFSAWDRARFTQLVDLGHAQDLRGELRAGAFVALVREQRVEDPGRAPVRVLTVHGAKGLEYDAVVLADLDYELPRRAGRAPKFLASRRGPDGRDVAAGPVTAVVRNVPREQLALHPLLAELAAREQRRALEEQLCVLYVALTRARVRLDLFIEARRAGARQPSCRFGELLRECFGAPPAAEPGSDGVLSRDGDENAAWPPRRAGAALATLAAPPTPSPSPATASLGAAFAAAAQRLPHTRTPSGGAQRVRCNARELLAATPHAALERGLLLHRCCEDVAWLEGDLERPTGIPTRERLLAAARKLVALRGLSLDEAALVRGVAEFEALLGTAAARSVFRCPDRAPADVTADRPPDLWRERRFAVAVADGEFLRGSFDRVVLWRAGRRVVAAEIIDFKSDEPPSERAAGAAAVHREPGAIGERNAGPDAALDVWLDERVRRYASQMEDYRTALARLTDLPTARIACRLLFLQAGESRLLPAGD